MPRRSRLTVLYTILNSIQKNPGINATHLMYKSNISYAQLKTYIKLLNEWGLVQIQKKERAISLFITEKGNKVLELLKNLEKVLYEEKTVKIRQIL